MKRKIWGILLIMVMAVGLCGTAYGADSLGWIKMEDGSYVKGVSVAAQGEENYSYAFQVLDILNQERAAEGLEPLTMDQSLLETAMLRAMETSLVFSHTRPCGYLCFSANELMQGENIAAGQSTPKRVMTDWMTSTGHRANILRSSYTSIGIGCVQVDGTYYWVQCFGTALSEEAQADCYSNETATRTVVVAQDDTYYSAEFRLSATSLKVGESAQASVLWNQFTSEPFVGITMTSSDDSICRVEGSQVVAVAPGTAEITMYYDDYPNGGTTIQVTVTEPVKDTISSGSATGFTDVPENAWYADAVAWAVENDITDGTSDTTFSPDNSCTRAQVVTFLWRAAGEPEPTVTENPFTDVKEGAYYYKAVLWAVEKGITDGMSDTTFEPDGTCTRGQVVTFLYRYAGEPEVSTADSPFTDVKAGAYYEKAVAWAVSKEITNGMSDATFAPDNTCTRAQVVTFLWRDLVG